jgi:hypothetical protein
MEFDAGKAAIAKESPHLLQSFISVVAFIEIL